MLKMRRSSVFVLILLLLSMTTPASSAVQFYDNCEDYPNLNGDWRLRESSGKLSVSSEQKRAGNKSYKFAFKAGTTDYEHGTKRVELRLSKKPFGYFQFNKEYWVGYSIYIPSNFMQPTGWAIAGQWHKMLEAGQTDCDQAPRPENPAVSEPFSAHFKGTDAAPRLSVKITGQSQRCQPDGYTYRKSFDSPKLKKGQWNDVVIHTIFSYNKKGLTQMWLNGEKFIDIKEINAHNDELPHYLKLGFYGSSKKNHTVYYDEIRVGDASSSYAEVAPRKKTAARVTDFPGSSEQRQDFIEEQGNNGNFNDADQ
jgi:hypothetical protein